MDSGHQGDFEQDGLASVPPPSMAKPVVRVDLREARPTATARPRAFHYAAERNVSLGQIAEHLPRAVSCRLSPAARRMPVIAVRLTSLAGSSVHAAPTLTADALFLDNRDLAALEAGAVVPDLAEVVARIA